MAHQCFPHRRLLSKAPNRTKVAADLDIYSDFMYTIQNRVGEAGSSFADRSRVLFHESDFPSREFLDLEVSQNVRKCPQMSARRKNVRLWADKWFQPNRQSGNRKPAKLKFPRQRSATQRVVPITGLELVPSP